MEQVEHDQDKKCRDCNKQLKDTDLYDDKYYTFRDHDTHELTGYQCNDCHHADLDDWYD